MNWKIKKNKMDNDLISRQAAIDLAKDLIIPSESFHQYNQGVSNYCAELVKLQPTEPPYNLDEWCHDCKEYDQERHCCPRWNRVIKQTKEDFEAQNEIIHCTDCRYHGTAICRIWSRYGTINVPGYGFCYRAERKEQDEGD